MTVVTLIRILQELLQKHKKKVFTLKEISALAESSRPAAAMTLLRGAKKGIVGRSGNLWFNLMDPPHLFEIALSVPSPSYLSFESALHHHGLISQAPRGTLTMATTGRSRLLQTSLGIIRFIHLKPSLFFGFDSERIALPEKAWLDLIYIRGLKKRQSIISEEVYFDDFNRKRLKKLEGTFPSWVKNLANSTGR